MRRSALVAGLLVATACGGDDVGPAHSSREVRIEVDALSDLSTPIPEDVTGIELGESAPTPAPFCDVVAETRSDFLGGALVPHQYWVDSFALATGVPESAVAPLDRLVDRGRRILIYRLRGTGEAVFVGEDGADDLLELLGVAVESCPDLPPVLGTGWERDAPSLTADECNERREQLEVAIDGYRDRVGAEPDHVAQVEVENLRAAYQEFDVPPFVVLGDHAVEAVNGRATAVPAPAGRCDQS